MSSWPCLPQLTALLTAKCIKQNWMAPWKNQICSTTKKTEKITGKASDVAENLQLYRVVWFFHPKSLCTTAHLMLFSERPPIYAYICVVQDDLGWKDRTTWYDCRFSAASLALPVIFIRRKRPPINASYTMISGGRTKQHVIIGFGELAAVD